MKEQESYAARHGGATLYSYLLELLVLTALPPDEEELYVTGNYTLIVEGAVARRSCVGISKGSEAFLFSKSLERKQNGNICCWYLPQPGDITIRTKSAEPRSVHMSTLSSRFVSLICHIDDKKASTNHSSPYSSVVERITRIQTWRHRHDEVRGSIPRGGKLFSC